MAHFKWIIFISLFAVACTPLPTRDPAFAPVEPADLRAPAQNSGSIYQANYDMRLFEDHTAKRVGDVLTIRLVERTQAKKLSDMEARKNTSLSVKAPLILGMEAAQLLGHDVETEVATNHQFTGEGEANQSNSLTGDLSVTVVEVLPNGNLRVRGEKRVALNQGSEYVRLSGIVRPVDIDVANSVLSSRVADATIMYTGDGAVADASKMGWLARFFISPWFPF
ncbi:MAG: flagellar basal body L-ring protein FlgH [Gammaproteobacteria bacterium]|uniref:flagellar basal body L-ring protein FlgH n=1 Tax=Methylotuvimicrobium sp. KM1 TaxID=3377707 RepID=UPI001DBC098C|nr:flagellar basal body L-ring protein FlgH [Gammaproteobacteria bacterium]